MLRLYVVFVNVHGPLPPSTCDLVSMTPELAVWPLLWPENCWEGSH